MSHLLSRSVLLALAFALLVLPACDSESDDPDPDPTLAPDLVLVVGFPDPSGAEGSSFLQAVSLDAGSVTNAAALESTFQPFIYGRGRSILAVPNLFS
ncbi:MAG: hypothetical protein AAF809_14010, partial [Bacteroidota bacterium]